MLELVAIWLVLLIGCIGLATRRQRSGTLFLSYFLGLSLIHVPGAVNYLGEFGEAAGSEETLIGFQVTLIGMASLLTGVAIQQLASGAKDPKIIKAKRVRYEHLGKVLLFAGASVFFVLLPVAGMIPSITSALSAAASLLVVGYWCYIKGTLQKGASTRTMILVASLPLLPVATLATGGFVGFGVYWMISIICFLLVNSRRRLVYFLAAPAVVYLGLSLGVTYLAERTHIREAVWYQNATYSDRFERIGTMFSAFELYDFNNIKHHREVDSRMNQNFLVGSGVLMHRSDTVELFYGSTVPLWSLIPRAVWPEKPQVGGGGELVTEFTGIEFSEGTSVGAGQPLEFYANFAWPGVILGFFFLGSLLSFLDQGLATSFHTGDVRRILIFALPGLALIQPGGNLLEMLISFLAAVVAARLFSFGLLRLGFFRFFPRMSRRVRVKRTAA